MLVIVATDNQTLPAHNDRRCQAAVEVGIFSHLFRGLGFISGDPTKKMCRTFKKHETMTLTRPIRCICGSVYENAETLSIHHQ